MLAEAFLEDTAKGTFVCMRDGYQACLVQEAASCDKAEWSKSSQEYKQPDRVMAEGSTAHTFGSLCVQPVNRHSSADYN